MCDEQNNGPCEDCKFFRPEEDTRTGADGVCENKRFSRNGKKPYELFPKVRRNGGCGFFHRKT
ncbi:unnamed protein product [marine sediment metagenome]|uniref:Uncharacterized protein n=1 Tax=marine sediment metagenome TaxID=412755 RepID=X0T8Z8_9ZZZZ